MIIIKSYQRIAGHAKAYFLQPFISLFVNNNRFQDNPVNANALIIQTIYDDQVQKRGKNRNYWEPKEKR